MAISMLIRNSRVEISRITLNYAHKKSSAEAELNLKNKRLVFLSFHLVTEWHKSQNHQLEVLQTKWNTDNCDAEDNTHCQVSESHFNTAKYDPEYVEQQRKTAHWLVALHYLATKWPQGEKTQTHNLQSEWNTHDCKAQNKSAKEVAQRKEQSAKNHPDNVTD